MSRTIGQVPPRQHNKDRMRRAESWLRRSKKVEQDLSKVKAEKDKMRLYCEQFMFLWITFSAAYGQDLRKAGGKKLFRDFLGEVIKRDYDNAIYKSIADMRNASYDPIGFLIANKYVFKPFWDFARGSITEQVWLDRFGRARRRFELGWYRKNRVTILEEIFDRLYELRNQIFHGGAVSGG